MTFYECNTRWLQKTWDYLSLTVIWAWNTKVSQTFTNLPVFTRYHFSLLPIWCRHTKALYELFPRDERLYLYFFLFSFFSLIETWGKWLACELAGDWAHTTQPYANIPTGHTPHFHCAFEDEMTKWAGAQWSNSGGLYLMWQTTQGHYSRELSQPHDVCIRNINPFECARLKFACFISKNNVT